MESVDDFRALQQSRARGGKGSWKAEVGCVTEKVEGAGEIEEAEKGVKEFEVEEQGVEVAAEEEEEEGDGEERVEEEEIMEEDVQERVEEEEEEEQATEEEEQEDGGLSTTAGSSIFGDTLTHMHTLGDSHTHIHARTRMHAVGAADDGGSAGSLIEGEICMCGCWCVCMRASMMIIDVCAYVVHTRAHALERMAGMRGRWLKMTWTNRHLNERLFKL